MRRIREWVVPLVVLLLTVLLGGPVLAAVGLSSGPPLRARCRGILAATFQCVTRALSPQKHPRVRRPRSGFRPPAHRPRLPAAAPMVQVRAADRALHTPDRVKPSGGGVPAPALMLGVISLPHTGWIAGLSSRARPDAGRAPPLFSLL